MQVPGEHLFIEDMESVKLLKMVGNLKGSGGLLQPTPAAGTASPTPCAARYNGWSWAQGLLCPAEQIEGSGHKLSAETGDLPQASCGPTGCPCPPPPRTPPLHRPPYSDAAHVGVEVEEGPDAERLRHDVAEWWPLRRLQAQQTEDQLAQLRAVSVRDRRKGAAHNL